MKHLFLALALSLAGGCATVGTLQTANTVGRDHIQLGIEPGAVGQSYEGVGLTLPQLGVSFRYGATDTIDLGARLGTSGIELLSKFQLTDPENDRLIVSIAPSGGGFALGLSGATAASLSFQVPVLIGIGVGEHQIVLGPKIHERSAFATVSGSSAVAHQIGVGSSFGFGLRLGKRVTLLPEVAFVAPIATFGATGTDATASFDTKGLSSQYTLGILVDLGK